MPDATLALDTDLPVRAHNAGLFVSRGQGRHPERVIDSHELIFVRQGELAMFEADRRFRATAGEILRLRPGLRHGGSEPYARDLRFYWIHFEVRAHRTPRRALRVPVHATVRRPDRLAELFGQFLHDQETGRLSPARADALLCLMLCEAADVRPERDDSAGTAATLAGRAERLLEERFAESLSTADAARALRCNADYLGRIFRRVHGCSFLAALHRRRLQEARLLLLEGERNVDEVARACGFREAGYFRRIFRREEGITPLAFRGLHARMHVNTR